MSHPPEKEARSFLLIMRHQQQPVCDSLRKEYRDRNPAGAAIARFRARRAPVWNSSNRAAFSETALACG